ncbi:MAG: hypothetical protein F6K18_24380 [Okeania sp. SIO2C2]|uniref:hypothetical protein n=1 Tax=Okeania sp. SIO2C2 TaxID=2607787 RepID=UPI0013B5F1A3|nr:hypothetical protein [Okeania sp. SIO2C2]NEP89717.1 hypothetical protein [Okeania sp. SIO2C2]
MLPIPYYWQEKVSTFKKKEGKGSGEVGKWGSGEVGEWGSGEVGKMGAFFYIFPLSPILFLNFLTSLPTEEGSQKHISPAKIPNGFYRLEDFFCLIFV